MRMNRSARPIRCGASDGPQLYPACPFGCILAAAFRILKLGGLMFRDRNDAGRQLLHRLPPLDPAETVVIALPRGGVPVAEVIAQGITARLDVVFVRKVGLPGQRELAVAAVTNGDSPVLTVNEEVARHAGLDSERIWVLAQAELETIARRRAQYLGTRVPVPVKDKTVVVVDDGIATGATMRASLRSLRKRGAARLIVAVPVGPEETLVELHGEADEIICLATPRPFRAVGLHYQRFDQVTDEEVIAALSRATAR